MSMLNFHDPSCDAYSVALGCERDDIPCTCPPLQPMPPLTYREGPPDRVADETTKFTDVVIGMPINIEPNPVFVYGSGGKVIGSAVLEFVKGGMQARLILDAHNPEAFDLANEPGRCTFKLMARILNGEMDKASLWLESK